MMQIEEPALVDLEFRAFFLALRDGHRHDDRLPR